LAVIGIMGAVPNEVLIVTRALCGAMTGFAPYNQAVARFSATSAAPAAFVYFQL
jgi:hypothetical protein